MDANKTDFKNMTMLTEDTSPEHHADNPEDQSAGEEVRSPRSTPLTCRHDKEASSLAYSQSGAKTEADNTISDPSAFGDYHIRGSSLTTMQKTKKHPFFLILTNRYCSR